MELYVIRHAWAGNYGDPRWPDDGQRPLTDEGRRRFSQMLAKLAQQGFDPEVVATSPMVRCVETARLVAEAAASRPDVIELDQLLPGGDPETLMEWTARQSRRYCRIALVGHAPDVGRLAAALIGQRDGWVRFSKGALAAVRFHGLPAIGDGELRWLVTAKVLGC